MWKSCLFPQFLWKSPTPDRDTGLILQRVRIDDIFANGKAKRPPQRDIFMSIFETDDDGEFDEKDKVRLFETERNRGSSVSGYARKFFPVALIVIAGLAAAVYFLMPGTGDEIQGSHEMRRAVVDHLKTKEKRDLTEVTFYKCDGYFWAKALAEPKPYPPSLLLDDVNQFRIKVTQTGKDTYQSETLPLPAKTDDVPCGNR